MPRDGAVAVGINSGGHILIISLFLLLFFAHGAIAGCVGDCIDEKNSCKTKCGPNSYGTACYRMCEANYDHCIDACYGRKKKARTTISSTVDKEPEERKYCSDFHNVIEKLEYEAMVASGRENFCAAIAKYSRAIKKIGMAPEECKVDGGWMQILLKKKLRFQAQIEEYKTYCKHYSSAGSGIKVHKDSSGITLKQE